ncbi:MAG: hypothetical protein Q8R81_04175 [Novosphingobium sp.]|uniref:hypothetical protein n=1 Tax=Novosphingobium sp. TaxID=1874826 RepID=UPI002735566D|nr:hypothetical protein [Novosphingobium sp.]MDP3549577.1 hypothetical protein [Novosphingobium sp.]
MEIYIYSRERLLSLDFLYALAIRITELNLSRLKSTDWLASTIFNFEGTIYDWNGRPLYIDDAIVDRAYGKDESGTWNSEVKRFVDHPPQRSPRHSMLLRLALWCAAMEIHGTPVLD